MSTNLTNRTLVHSTSPNAATPGDNCANITTRLFLEAEKPEQIYAVLAHEFGHIIGTHQVNQIERRKTTEISVAVIAGIGAGPEGYANAGNPYARRTDWGQVTRNAMSAYQPWNKNDEFEADVLGLAIYMHLGLDPDGFVSLFELFRDRWGDVESPSHPRNTDRIKRLQEALASMEVPASFRRLDERQFQQIQQALAIKLESLQRSGFLVSEEIELTKRMASGALSTQVSACGPLNLDEQECAEGFATIQANRKRRR